MLTEDVATQPGWLRDGFTAEPEAASGNGRARTGAAEAAARAQRLEAGRRYVRHVPTDVRAWRWLATWLVVPSDRDPRNRWFPRWRRIKFALARSYPNARDFLGAVLGRRVRGVEYATRQNACDACPFLRIRLPARPSGKFRRYCAACGCPDWPLSELSRKNRFAGWRCPRGRHPKPEDWAARWIREREAELTGAAGNG